MDARSRRKLTASSFAEAMARANPGLKADMLRVTANRHGWLEEVWVCLDTAYRYPRCPSFQGGLAKTARPKVWRGVRGGNAGIETLSVTPAWVRGIGRAHV